MKSQAEINLSACLQTTDKDCIDTLLKQAEATCQTPSDYEKLELLQASAYAVNWRNYLTRTKAGTTVLDIHQMPSVSLLSDAAKIIASNCSTHILLESQYKVITLCGSTKFKMEYEVALETLTNEGCIVLYCPIFHHADNLVLSQEESNRYDDMHRQRIRISDAIYVINKGGYIGESTEKEIAYAKELGKEILFFDTLKFV